MAWNTTGCRVDTQKQSTSTILFALAGQATVRQWEVVTVSEVRGLDGSAARGRVPDSAAAVANTDSTVQTQYWAFIAGKVHTISVVTGYKTEYSAARKDETDQWVCTETRQDFFATGMAANVWGTTDLNADGTAVTLSESGAPAVVSVDKTTSFVRDFYNNNLYSTIATTVTEYRFVSSQSAATAIVNSHSAAAAQTTVHTPYTAPDPTNPDSIVPVSYAAAQIPVGTEEFASARFVSAAEGWTVTVTTKVYGYYSTLGNWSAS